MSVISSLMVKIGADSSGLKKELSNAQAAINSSFDTAAINKFSSHVEQSAKQVEGLIGKVKTFAAVAAAGFGLSSFIKGTAEAGDNLYRLSQRMHITAAEAGMLVSRKTKVDIIVTPLVTIAAGALLSVLFAGYIGKGAAAFGNLIVWATTLKPFLMGVIISVIVGILLTLPVSSAAICAALGLTGLAGGAAVAGCCAQMVGFAIMSFRENKWSGLLSQGLGTSMLQMPNIVKNPRIWIPPVVASAITGPIATCVFKMEMNGAAVSSGMGTCGLVGQIGVISGWFDPSAVAVEHGAAALAPGAFNWLGLILVCFVLPGLISWGLGLLLRKAGWIKERDLLLS